MNEIIPEGKIERTGSLWPSALLLVMGFVLGVGLGYQMRSSSIAILKKQALSLSIYMEGYKLIAVYNTYLVEGGTQAGWEDRGTRVRAYDEYSKRFHENVTNVYAPKLLDELTKRNADWKTFILDESVD